MHSNSLHNNFLLSLKACNNYDIILLCNFHLLLYNVPLSILITCDVQVYLCTFEVKKAKNMPHNHTNNYYISPTQPMDMDVCSESIIAYA